MAVRQGLQDLLRDRQFTGAIVVESLPTPASTARVGQLRRSLPLARRPEAALPAAALPVLPPPPPPVLPPPPPPVLPPPPPPVLPPTPPKPTPPQWQRQRAPKPEDCAVFHCSGCWAVLGDSLHLCAQEDKRLGLLVCFKVTNNVIWEDSLVVGLGGALLGCAYKALSCRSCGSMVGLILHSASRDLAYLRGFFCFFKESVICYLLENQTVTEASKVNFPPVTLMKQLQELKVKLVHAHYRLEYVMKLLEEQTK